MSLREALKKKYAESPLLSLHVPEWDTTIYFRSLRGDESDVFRLATPEGASAARYNAQIVCIKALDKAGVRLFPSNEDAEILVGEHPVVITRIATEICKVTTVENAEKNSSANPA